MSPTSAISRHVLLTALTLAIGAAVPVGPGRAQEQPSTDQIIQQLQPKPKVRSFSMGGGGSEAKQQAIVNDLQNKPKTRQITVEERQQIVDVVKENDLPAIDLEVFFDYNSAAITPEAEPTLVKLGDALSSDKLRDSVFMLAGHTDAKGSDQYNLGLSQARANSVRDYLIARYHLDPKQLLAVGFGEEDLKNPQDPFAAENRRVQVVNMADKTAAAKPAPEPVEDAPPQQ